MLATTPGLQSRLKRAGLTRTVAPEETARRNLPLARRFGVTRVADITGLDRIGIPVFSAIVPRSNDFISIYNGKGLHCDEARAGAIMEAIERQANLTARPATVRASVDELRGTAAVINPAEIVSRLSDTYAGSRKYEWVEGVNLLDGETTLVPAGIAGYRWRHLPEGSPLKRTTTHGLAAGNCLEEGVSQALCEWVERDSWTLAEIAAHWRKRAETEVAMRRVCDDDFVDDLERYPCIDFSGIGGAVELLVDRFRSAGLDPVVRDISSELGIPSVVAAVAEDDVPGFPQAHMGVGAHPDLRVAAARALTEAAQSRAADIQGVREDLAPAEGDGDAAGVVIHTRRVKCVDRRRWLHRPSVSRRHWSEIEEHRHADILDDIRLMLAKLKRAGIRQAVAVDLSPPDTGVYVVRVIVPGLEMWIADRGRIGNRAAALWRTLGAAHA